MGECVLFQVVAGLIGKGAASVGQGCEERVTSALQAEGKHEARKRVNARIMSPPLFRLERMCGEEGARKKLVSPIAKTSFHFTTSDLNRWRYLIMRRSTRRASPCLAGAFASTALE